MNRSQFVALFNERYPSIAKKDIEKSIDLIIDTMSTTLEQHRRIEIRGFGSFSVRMHPARRAINPRTGEKLMTEPKPAVHFSIGKDLKIRLQHALTSGVALVAQPLYTGRAH